jgi:hypothetical protein
MLANLKLLRFTEPVLVHDVVPVRFDKLREEVSVSIAMLAHKEESGSKSATSVIAMEPASGKFCWTFPLIYSRMAKQAMKN